MQRVKSILDRPFLFAIFSVLLLSGCQNPLVKPSTSSATDELAQLRQEAATAYNNKDFQTALVLYQQLTAAIPNDATIWLRTGNVLARLNRPAEAIQYYQETVSKNPKLAIAWHNMGVLQLRQAANTLVQMVQNINPDDPLYPRAVALSEATLQILGKRRTDPGTKAANGQ
jgi:tetratricopeptide (TPR) repeat protein